MIRVFHVPAHLAYAALLSGQRFAPVPSPTGESLTVAQLTDLASWEFFDVLHLHSVELASLGDLDRLCGLARRRGVGLVLTVHDLLPNIETDEGVYWQKLALVADRADAVLTLTAAAAAMLTSRDVPNRTKVVVTPHGSALPLGIPTVPSRRGGSETLAVYGALRPNRDVAAMADAWRLLPAATRPVLRILLRSVGPADEERDADQLARLRSAAAAESRLHLDVRSTFLPPGDLLRWLAPAGGLVLPYRWITHSGQLELACDLGLPVLAPDTSTLRAQLEHNGVGEHPVTWYPADELAKPAHLGTWLMRVSRIPRVAENERRAFLQRRRTERARLLRLHQKVYDAAVGDAATLRAHDSSTTAGSAHRDQADR